MLVAALLLGSAGQASTLVLNPPVFLAGGLAASFSHTVSVPIDVVKTRQQMDPSIKGDGGALELAMAIVRDEGPAAMLLGSSSTLFGYFLQGGLKYGLYDGFKPEFAALLPDGAPRVVTLVCAAMAAESIASLCLCPLEAVRIRAVCDPEYARRPLLESVGGVLESGEVFESLLPIYLKMIPYTAMQLSTYELTRSAAEQVVAGGGGLGGQLACASVAAVVASLASQPGDALLSAANQRAEELCVNPPAAGAPPTSATPLAASSAVSSTLQVVGDLGLEGLFRGTFARLLQVLVIVVVQLVANDSFRELCGVHSVGH
jgi:solute carrier family 25 phosphate transporter 3